MDKLSNMNWSFQLLYWMLR